MKHFKDSAHVDYDCAIWKLAEIDRFLAFGEANTSVSVTYYGPQGMNSRRYQCNDYNVRHMGELVNGFATIGTWVPDVSSLIMTAYSSIIAQSVELEVTVARGARIDRLSHNLQVADCL